MKKGVVELEQLVKIILIAGLLIIVGFALRGILLNILK